MQARWAAGSGRWPERYPVGDESTARIAIVGFPIERSPLVSVQRRAAVCFPRSSCSVTRVRAKPSRPSESSPPKNWSRRATRRRSPRRIPSRADAELLLPVATRTASPGCRSLIESATQSIGTPADGSQPAPPRSSSPAAERSGELGSRRSAARQAHRRQRPCPRSTDSGWRPNRSCLWRTRCLQARRRGRRTQQRCCGSGFFIRPRSIQHEPARVVADSGSVGADDHFPPLRGRSLERPVALVTHLDAEPEQRIASQRLGEPVCEADRSRRASS